MNDWSTLFYSADLASLSSLLRAALTSTSSSASSATPAPSAPSPALTATIRMQLSSQATPVSYHLLASCLSSSPSMNQTSLSSDAAVSSSTGLSALQTVVLVARPVSLLPSLVSNSSSSSTLTAPLSARRDSNSNSNHSISSLVTSVTGGIQQLGPNLRPLQQHGGDFLSSTGSGQGSNFQSSLHASRSNSGGPPSPLPGSRGSRSNLLEPCSSSSSSTDGSSLHALASPRTAISLTSIYTVRAIKV